MDAMFRSIDWTVTGLSAGVAVLAAGVAYEAFVLIPSGSVAPAPQPYKLASVPSSSSILIPARDRPTASVNAIPSGSPAAAAPVLVFAPAAAPPPNHGAHSYPSANAAYPPPNAAYPSANAAYPPPNAAYPPPNAAYSSANAAYPPPNAAYPPPNAVGPNPRWNPPLPEQTASRYNDYPPPPPAVPVKRWAAPMPEQMGGRLNERMPPAEYASLPRTEPKPPVPMTAELWRVETTAKANYFNLGGHVDKDGVVDSLASSYLRDALKKHRNYPKLPPQIKAYIEAPNINLAKIAGYRAMLGVDDRKMEAEQGVKFVKVASRGVELAASGAGEDPAAGEDVPPLDLNALQRMLTASRQK